MLAESTKMNYFNDWFIEWKLVFGHCNTEVVMWRWTDQDLLRDIYNRQVLEKIRHVKLSWKTNINTVWLLTLRIMYIFQMSINSLIEWEFCDRSKHHLPPVLGIHWDVHQTLSTFEQYFDKCLIAHVEALP